MRNTIAITITNNMKLYTEEQVREAFIAGMEFIAVIPLKYEQDANKYMNSITPIELPTDEEIKEGLFHYSNEYAIGFKDGIEYIKQQYK